MLSEKSRDVLTTINNYLPEWAEFNVKQYGRIYQANIVIESDYFKPFRISTESTCLEDALTQILQMLEVYWVYKEDSSPELDQLIEELKREEIIQ